MKVYQQETVTYVVMECNVCERLLSTFFCEVILHVRNLRKMSV